MTYADFFAKVKELLGGADVSDIREHLAYQFNITGEAEGIFYVEVKMCIRDRYRDVASSLLGRILVVDHVDNAVRLARQAGYSLRTVSYTHLPAQNCGGGSGG